MSFISCLKMCKVIVYIVYGCMFLSVKTALGGTSRTHSLYLSLRVEGMESSKKAVPSFLLVHTKKEHFHCPLRKWKARPAECALSSYPPDFCACVKDFIVNMCTFKLLFFTIYSPHIPIVAPSLHSSQSHPSPHPLSLVH